MTQTADLSPTIVDTLYCEALELADRVRAAFDLSGRLTATSEDEDLARIALSCEALRTTTRMMHAIAWLLNQRAFLAGELSERTQRFYARIERLDQAWRTRFEMQPAAIHRLRERLGLAVVGI
jgi:regulator of CtrA degradation